MNARRRFGLALAATLLREPVTWVMLVVTVGVIACVAGARRFSRQAIEPGPAPGGRPAPDRASN